MSLNDEQRIAANQERPVTDISRDDVKTTLHDLLTHFRESEQQTHDIERFADAGTDALLAQAQAPEWLNQRAGAYFLHLTEDALVRQVAEGAIPAVRDGHGQAWFHRRDLSLYRMAQRLGATEEQLKRMTPPVAWGPRAAELGVDPWTELTPG